MLRQQFSGSNLVTHLLQPLRSRSDEGEPMVENRLRERRIFSKKAITRMDTVSACIGR